jgi:hypothetical protein
VSVGGSDELPDEALVRQSVRRLLDGGVLPHFSLGRLVAAPCIVPHGCAICRAQIKIKEPEIEIVSRTGAARIYLHRRCFDIWGEEASAEQAPPKLEP